MPVQQRPEIQKVSRAIITKPIADQRKGVAVASTKVQVKRQINARAEQVEKVMFLTAKPPDPSKRIIRHPQKAKPRSN